MCRSIKPLFNYDPPSGDAEIRAAARQYVRKVSGFTEPSAANQAAFDQAVGEVAETTARLLGSLTTKAPPRDRAEEADRARARAALRFSPR